MVIFGYEHEWGMMLPDDDDVWRVMITSDFKNNVIVWKGYDKEIAQYTLDNVVIWDIQELISNQKKLFQIEKLEEDFPSVTDIPCYDFFFADNEGRHKLLSGYMFGYRRGKVSDFPNTDFVINLTLKIQKILQDNGINIEMWDNKHYSDD